MLALLIYLVFLVLGGWVIFLLVGLIAFSVMAWIVFGVGIIATFLGLIEPKNPDVPEEGIRIKVGKQFFFAGAFTIVWYFIAHNLLFIL